MTDRTTQLAFEIADSAASSDIECYCQTAGGEPKTVEEMRSCFYDIANPTDPEDAECIAVAVEYLDSRGLLKRHQENANWVRPRHGIEIARAA